MDRGAWQASVHGVAKSRTWLSNFTFTFHSRVLEKEMATHSSILTWRVPGTGEPGGLPSIGSHRVRHDWSDLAAVAAGVVKFLGISVKPWSYLKLLHTLEYLQQNLNSINQKKSTHTHHPDSIIEKRISKKGRVYPKSSVLRPFVSETCLL